jgi:hypothetical protein
MITKHRHLITFSDCASDGSENKNDRENISDGKTRVISST